MNTINDVLIDIKNRLPYNETSITHDLSKFHKSIASIILDYLIKQSFSKYGRKINAQIIYDYKNLSDRGFQKILDKFEGILDMQKLNKITIPQQPIKKKITTIVI